MGGVAGRWEEGVAGAIQCSDRGRARRMPEAVIAPQGLGEHGRLADDGGGR